MDYNDQQNANLGAGYTDPDGDDSFIDDSTAAQDILPKNMTNERDGFYVNKKHQPITARYFSEPSESESDDGEESDDDDDSEESEDDEEKSKKKLNHVCFHCEGFSSLLMVHCFRIVMIRMRRYVLKMNECFRVICH